MKKFHVVMYSALLLLFCRALGQAQQSLTSTRNSTSTAGGQVVSNVSGTGATDYVPLWLSATKLGNSRIFQSSVGVGIGTTSPAATLDVDGAVNAATSFNLGGTPFAFGTLSKSNAFLGFSGNSTMTGGDNTASFVGGLWTPSNWTTYFPEGGVVSTNANCTTQAAGQLICGVIGAVDNAFYADLYNGAGWEGWIKIGSAGIGIPACGALGAGKVVCVVMGINNKLTSVVGP